MIPLEHLSASSINMFLRCPRQFQENYIRGVKGPSNSSLVIGTAVHLGISRLAEEFDPREMGSFFDDAVEEHLKKSTEIIWKDKPEAARRIASEHVNNYYYKVLGHLDVIETEKEILLEIPGIPIPLLGYVDLVTSKGIIDVKTTGYFNKSPQVNPEWKLQMNIYQMEYPTVGEFHILTRSKTNPVVTPISSSDPLYIEPPTLHSTLDFVGKVYKEIEFMYETYGEDIDWRGNRTHPWAGKYCPVLKCCQHS